MSAAWTSDFDFFEARLAKDVVGSFFVDLAAKEHAPVASHPVRLAVRVAMRAPRPDGLRSSEEAEALYALEDRVTAAVKDGLDAVFVGRVVAQGYLSFVFYLPGASVALADGLTRVTGSAAPYALEWNLDDDPEWDFYRELLYPDDATLADIKSRRAVDRVMGRAD
jgi:hypothetical protein